MSVYTILGKQIGTTRRHWDATIRKHESVTGLEEQVKGTLRNPAYVRLSKEDKAVYLYYAPYSDYFLRVVCCHLNGEGFIITAYLTGKIKKGVTVYETDYKIVYDEKGNTLFVRFSKKRSILQGKRYRQRGYLFSS